MKVIFGGVEKDLHYSIAKRLLESGQATMIVETDIVEIDEVEPKFSKKIVKNTGKKKHG